MKPDLYEQLGNEDEAMVKPFEREVDTAEEFSEEEYRRRMGEIEAQFKLPPAISQAMASLGLSELRKKADDLVKKARSMLDGNAPKYSRDGWWSLSEEYSSASRYSHDADRAGVNGEKKEIVEYLLELAIEAAECVANEVIAARRGQGLGEFD